MLFNYIGKHITINQVVQNFYHVSNSENKYAVLHIESLKTAQDLTNGAIEEEKPIIAKTVKTNFYTNFISHSLHYDKSDVLCSKVALFILPVAIILSVASFFLNKNIYITLTVITGVLAMATTIIGGLIVAFPLHDTSKVLRHFSDASPCVDSIEKFKDTNCIMLDAYDLFPSDTIILHGIKTFHGNRIDEAIVDAASVVCASKVFYLMYL